MAFTVYKSSAGSGKTFTLVQSYLKIVLLRPQDYRHILAVTFTNKAASEMKSRITDALRIISQSNTENPSQEAVLLFQSLTTATGLSPQKIKAQAALALSLILHHYADFAVSTIDSFYGGIVRSFAKDLQLPMNFDIELDAKTLLKQAVDILISRVGHDEALTNILVQYIESRVDENKGLHIEKFISETGAYVFREESIVPLTKLKDLSIQELSELTGKIHGIVAAYEHRIANIAHKAFSLIESSHIPTDAFYYKEKGLMSYFKKLSTGNTEGVFNKNISKGVENDKWTSPGTSQADASAIDGIKELLRTYWIEIQEIAQENTQNIALLKLMAKNAYPLSVINELSRIIDDIKAENNIIHISEFNKKIAEIVLTEPVPYIYERIGAKYKHYMVDEFQDTSILQWTNMLPLIENALSENGFTMVVGDGKQAIYRWRDGEVEQFMNLPDVFAVHKNAFHYEKEKTLRYYYAAGNLQVNYRSKTDIVNFNNSFFDFAKNYLNDYYKNIYNDLTQKPLPNKKGGYVNIRFFEKDKLHDDMCAETESIISQIISSGEKAPGDIAVLCRKNDLGSAIAVHLMEKGIKVVSNESLLLNKSAFVCFLMAAIQFVDSPDNDIALCTMADFLYKTGRLQGQDFHEVVVGLKGSEKSPAHILKSNFTGFNMYALQKLPLYELCEQLIRIFHLNEFPNPFLQFFLDKILDFSAKRQNSIKDFLTYWEENADKFSVVIPESENAVKVMTIHKSKGLQFPVVIYPFVTFQREDPAKKNIWADIKLKEPDNISTWLLPIQKDLEKTAYAHLYEEEKFKTRMDVINLLYVALTRAEDSLYILSEKPEDDKDKFSPNFLLMSYLKHIGKWQNDISTYEFGQQSSVIKPLIVTAKNTDTNPSFDSFISTSWHDKLVIRFAAKDLWDFSNSLSQAQYGNLIHTALASTSSYDDIDKTLHKLQTEGLFEKKDLPHLKNILEEILKNPTIAHCFGKGARFFAEKELMDTDGKIYRPDRMVFYKNKAIIIDYKTGKPEEAHKKQLFKYAEILRKAKDLPVELFLVYISEDKGIKVQVEVFA